LNKPLISVVTVVYNGQAHIEQTIASVLSQTYSHIEYIIVDGGSTDNTLNIIKKYDSEVDCWVSEPDAGIYSAMNKGVKLCTGDFVAFLNSDDWYQEDAIESVVLSICDDTDYLFGNVCFVKNESKGAVFKPNLKGYKMYMPFGHPSLFMRRKLLLALRFNEQFKVIADYDLVIRLIESGAPYKYINQELVNYRVGGASSTGLFGEHFLLYQHHFGAWAAINNIFRRLYDKVLWRLRLVLFSEKNQNSNESGF